MKKATKRFVLASMYAPELLDPYFIVDQTQPGKTPDNYKCVYHKPIPLAVGKFVAFFNDRFIDEDDNLEDLVKRNIISFL